MNMPYTLPMAPENILAGKKIHTMRDDKRNSWQPGKLIHHCTGIRTKKYNCFLQNNVIATQQVLMVFAKDKLGKFILNVTIDRKRLSIEEIKELYINDGFYTYTAFRNWFFPLMVKGVYKRTMRVVKLIHWTDKKY